MCLTAVSCNFKILLCTGKLQSSHKCVQDMVTAKLPKCNLDIQGKDMGVQ